MTTAGVTDLANVVLILGSFTGVPDLLDLSENARYEFTPPNNGTDLNEDWKRTDLELKPTPPFAALCFGEHLYTPQGWVVGSSNDADACDLRLAETNKTGISRRHFIIDIHPNTLNPRLTVLSTGTVRMIGKGRTMILGSGDSLEIPEMVTVDLGAVSFKAWRPKLSVGEQKRYKTGARRFCQHAVAALPKYFPPLSSPPETITSNVRCGRDGAVYVNKGMFTGKGRTASVMMVEERASGELFGAKEPYYKANDDPGRVRTRWEDLKREYENIIKLEHVSMPLTRSLRMLMNPLVATHCEGR